MKSKWYLVASIFQVIIGVCAIVCFFVLKLNGENMARWYITLVLAVAFVIMGILGIKEHFSKK